MAGPATLRRTVVDRRGRQAQEEKAAERAVAEKEAHATTARSLGILHETVLSQGRKSSDSSMRSGKRSQEEEEDNAQAVDGDNGASR